MFVFDTIAHRLKRGCETMAYPKGPAPALPDRHGGALKVEADKCADGCSACVPVCPTQAITRTVGKPVVLDDEKEVEEISIHPAESRLLEVKEYDGKRTVPPPTTHLSSPMEPTPHIAADLGLKWLRSLVATAVAMSEP